MSYQIEVVFSSPTCSSVYTLINSIGEDDWSFLNYWDDLGEFLSKMILDLDSMISKTYPDGHDYSLFKVNIINIGDDEE